MAASLWMAFYLFARGFPNRITLRATLALMALAVFFLDTYNSFYASVSNAAHLRAALLIISLGCWYSVTFALRAPQKQTPSWWKEPIFYLLATLAIVLLFIIKVGIVREQEDILYTAHFDWNIATWLYGIIQAWAGLGILHNLATLQQIRYTKEGRSFFFASGFIAAALGYGALSFIIPARLPRVIEDGLVFGGVFFLGVSVARYQSLLERRTIWQDFPLGLLGSSIVTAAYLTVCVVAGVPANLWGNIAAAVITSHALYDLGREAVERWRINEDRDLRQKINQIKALEEETLYIFLDKELRLLLQALNSSSGLIATCEGDGLVVRASYNSLPIKSSVPKELTVSEGLLALDKQIPGLIWCSAIFENSQPVTLVGIGLPQDKLDYSSGELDLFEEFSDQIGIFISAYRARNSEIQSASDQIANNLTVNVDADLYKLVEEALRHFSDVVYLGQSALADWLDIQGTTHIQRGKSLQNVLREAVTSLRPIGERPPEPLPRDWYNYVVLHDAYIQGVQNREVMARLYVSEGTFHRVRRSAVRGLVRSFQKEKA
ncbi:MAG: hypothetical protein IT310_14590 [Anaerolineales bacterium]|nr:hypothetical protein [Anaerolineales bacterium]